MIPPPGLVGGLDGGVADGVAGVFLAAPVFSLGGRSAGAGGGVVATAVGSVVLGGSEAFGGSAAFGGSDGCDDCTGTT